MSKQKRSKTPLVDAINFLDAHAGLWHTRKDIAKGIGQKTLTKTQIHGLESWVKHAGVRKTSITVTRDQYRWHEFIYRVD